MVTHREIESDSTGTNRYFFIEYKHGKKTMSVKRTAQSLTLVLQKHEDEQAQLSDTLFWFDDSKDFSDTRKTIKVAVQDAAADEIVDL